MRANHTCTLIVVSLMLALMLCIGAFAQQEPALTILPGDVTLQWASVPPMSFTSSISKRAFRTLNSDEITRYTGLASKNRMIVDGAVCLIIDESKGTGTGYDVCYYLPPKQDSAGVDFARAVKLPLKKRDSTSSIMAVDGFPHIVDWPLGEGSNRKIASAAISGLNVYLNNNPNESGTAELSDIEVYSGRYGTIQTDNGPRIIWLSDGGLSGIYGDRVKYDPRTGQGVAGDSITIGDELTLRPYTSRSIHTLFLGKASAYEGKLYDVRISPNGETVSFKPYSGEKGILKIQTTDGCGKATQYFGGYLRNAEGLYAVHGSSDCDLPVGVYQCKRFLIGPDMNNAGDGKFRFFQYFDKPIAISKDKTFSIKLGGRMTFDIQTDSKIRSISVRRGEVLGVQIHPMIGKSRAEFQNGNPLNITIKDPSGRIVHSDIASQKYINRDPNNHPFVYSLSVPMDWKPSLYIMNVSYSGKPYQDLITGTKLIRVR